MTELFVFMLVIGGMLLSLLLVAGGCFVVWLTAKYVFPNSNFTETLNVIFEDPEDTHNINISKIKPWSLKDANRT